MDQIFLKLYNEFLEADKRLQERIKKPIKVSELNEIEKLQMNVKSKFDKLNNYKYH